MHSRIPEKVWRNRIARIIAGASVLMIAFAVQYYLAHIPLPVDIDATGKFSPAIVKLNQEELVIEEPVVNSPEGVLLAHDGHANEVVDVRFDRARLDEQTIEDLSNPKFKPPSTQGKIDYATPESKQTTEAGEPCRTFLRIELKDRRTPHAIHFYQLEAAGAGRHRHLEMKAGGAELLVQMVTDTPPEVTTETHGCRKLLRVGDSPEMSLPPSTQLAAIAAADSTFRFRFRPLTTDVPLWEDGPDGFFAPFEFGAPNVNPNDPPPFQARSVSIRKLQSNGSDSATILHAQSTDAGPLLRVYGLKVGSDELQIKVSGHGAMSVDGHALTVDFMERAQKYPIPAAILAGLNAALLAWFIRLISNRSESHAAK